MAINFSKESFIDFSKLESKNIPILDGILDSKNITGIEVRLSKARILNNKTPVIPPFFPGFAQLYVIELVISDVGNLVQTFDIKPFARVGNNEDLPIDKTLYYWKQNNMNESNPSQIHILTSIIKSKQKLRDTGKIMSDIKNDKDYSDLVSSLSSVISSVSNMNAISSILFSMVGIAGKFLGKVDDKPLITWVQSFTDINGDFDTLGVTTKSRKNIYAELDLSIIIRDITRETHLASVNKMLIEEIEIATKGELL